MNNYLKDFPFDHSIDLINSRLYALTEKSKKEYKSKYLKQINTFLDLTSLNVDDTELRINQMVTNVNNFKSKYPKLGNVAAVCVYPNFVSTVKKYLTSDVKIAAVAAGFPHSQTFIDIKLNEVERAIQEGADEIDIVLPVGLFLSEKYNIVGKELEMIREVSKDVTLKTILETGIYQYDSDIYNASILAMQCGADFIKTSTGKVQPAATPRAALIMCLAIKDFYKQTGKMVGLKPAGGISDGATALIYYIIVKEILGEEWLQPSLFRIGASQLANNILKEIIAEEGGVYEKYW